MIPRNPTSVFEHFQQVEDPRVERRKDHALSYSASLPKPAQPLRDAVRAHWQIENARR